MLIPNTAILIPSSILPRRQFVVYRVAWHRGIQNNSRLLNREGNRCCLGFVAQQCGATKIQILDVTTPQFVKPGIVPAWLVERTPFGIENTQEAVSCMVANDSPYWGDEDRELEIQSTFQRAGESIEFVDFAFVESP